MDTSFEDMKLTLLDTLAALECVAYAKDVPKTTPKIDRMTLIVTAMSILDTMLVRPAIYQAIMPQIETIPFDSEEAEAKKDELSAMFEGKHPELRWFMANQENKDLYSAAVQIIAKEAFDRLRIEGVNIDASDGWIDPTIRGLHTLVALGKAAEADLQARGE